MDITSCRNGKWLRKEVKVMKPLVTVVIPTTPDRILLLLKAHETVIKQTYDNIEVIIINDDKIKNRAEKYQHQYIRKCCPAKFT